MYGQPINPKRALFYIMEHNEDYSFGEPFGMFIVDMDDPSNDDIREVDHPDFDSKWENDSENDFTPRDENWAIQDAEAWCLSIGMVKGDSNICCTAAYVKKFDITP